ncbi:hypothetical protein GCM10027418_03400 [Mariniluteicoccus endophyticus]
MDLDRRTLLALAAVPLWSARAVPLTIRRPQERRVGRQVEELSRGYGDDGITLAVVATTRGDQLAARVGLCVTPDGPGTELWGR